VRSSHGGVADAEQLRAEDLLSVARRLRREVRTERRYPTRVALAVTGVLFAVAGVVYRAFPPVTAVLVPNSGGGYRIPREDPLANLGGQPPDRAAAIFWLVGVPLAWLACGWAFRRRRTGGLGSTPRSTVALGLAPFAVLVAGELLVAPHVDAVHRLLDDPDRNVLPALAVAAGLALVGLRERDLGLGLVAAIVTIGPAWLAIQVWGDRTPTVRPFLLAENGLTPWGGALVGLAGVLWALDRLLAAEDRRAEVRP